MGVTGLWRLIEPAGKPVPVETLENKVLAVDISIWLHQMVKGYQDAKGAPLPNAHLMGLFQRLCKLLYFRIKPIFVFDGAYPDLKKETIAKRQDHKAKYNSESERIKRELAILLSKKTAVNSLLGKQISPSKSGPTTSNNDDIFKLPALPQQEEESESESEDEQNSSGSSIDLHTLDLESSEFKTLGVKEKYDLLLELKETRKMNSWGKLETLPKKSDSFSDFQMQRLLKRRKLQECLEETEKEMGDAGMSLNDLESLLNEEGIDTKIDTLPTRRIASNVSTRFLLIKDVKQALAAAKKKKELENNPTTSKVEEITEIVEKKPEKVVELEDDLEKAIKMSLECVDESNEANTSVSKTDESWTSCMTDSDYSNTDSEEDDGFEQPDMTCAKSYIMQYSDFTHKAINKIVADKTKIKNVKKIPKVDEILEEINKEKSIIVDNVEISSSDEEIIEDKLISSSEENNLGTNETTDENFDATQASVVCIEKTQDVVIINSGTDETENESEMVIKQENHSSDEFEDVNTKEDTDSSDEFEEVPDIDKPIKPVVELTLKMGDAPEDDIFADVFEEKKKPVVENEEKSFIKAHSFEDNIVPDKAFKVPEVPKLSNKKYVEIKETENQQQQTATIKSSIQNTVIVNNTHKQETTISIVDSDKVETKNDSPAKKSEDNMCTIDNIQKPETTISIVDSDKVQINNKSPAKKAEDRIENAKDQSRDNNIAKVTYNPPVLNTERLNSMVEEIQNEELDLMQEKGRLDRVGRNITEQMTKEAQELLQIFGIPYIVAPTEAEAQCAFLESVKLTDGTITDDSDIWLFGGRTVYKNFFNQKKHVLQFLADRIETSYNLNREKLVLLALLVGSDYTTGLTGVGPVTALEILASFPFNKRQLLSESSKQTQYAQIVKGLQEFKQWVRAGKRTDNTSLKKKLKNVTVTEDFPSVRVVQAYLEPNIEKSEDKFTWGELDITILRDYTKAKFGWSQNKLDEIIKPVIKRMQDRKKQRSVQDFFKRKVEFLSLEEQMSKRVKAAIQKMGPEQPIGEVSESFEESSKPAVKRKIKSNGSKSAGVAGPSAAKQRKQTEASVLKNQGVKVVSQVKDGKSEFEIRIPKSDRVQEIIPQREKDKQSLLQNKMKAIELFRKTNIDKKKKYVKRKALQPKDKADLSESDSD